MKLFGEFYPPEQATAFMTQEFQERYFRFLADDETDKQIGDQLVPVADWMAQCNRAIRSGSRIVVVDKGLRASSPQLKRIGQLEVDWKEMPPTSIVMREGGHHYITVPVRHQWRDTEGSANVWLDGPNAAQGAEWFLCLDLADLATLRRYIHSRASRAGHISWLRAFRKAESVLVADLMAQQELRTYLEATALEHGVLTADRVHSAIDSAIATWRAAHRGAAAPQLDAGKDVEALLTLMYPADRLVSAADALLERLIAEQGAAPLRLCRTGKTRLVLYVEATDADRAPYAPGVRWGG